MGKTRDQFKVIPDSKYLNNHSDFYSPHQKKKKKKKKQPNNPVNHGTILPEHNIFIFIVFLLLIQHYHPRQSCSTAHVTPHKTSSF